MQPIFELLIILQYIFFFFHFYLSYSMKPLKMLTSTFTVVFVLTDAAFAVSRRTRLAGR